MKDSMQEEDKKFLRMAVELAVNNVESGGGPFGAVIVKNGKIISTGVNQVTLKNDPTAHAEIIAIRQAADLSGSHNLEGCTIYSSTEPCPMCLGAIYWAGLGKLVFASDKTEAEKAGFIDAHIYLEFNKSIEERSLPSKQLKIPSAGSEFRAWINKEDKEDY